MQAGLIVDSANEVIDVSADVVEPPAPAISGKFLDFVRGVVKLDNRLFILIDIDKILNQNVMQDDMKEQLITT